jgi:hypothetical protein
MPLNIKPLADATFGKHVSFVGAEYSGARDSWLPNNA